LVDLYCAYACFGHIFAACKVDVADVKEALEQSVQSQELSFVDQWRTQVTGSLTLHREIVRMDVKG
jgi:hypothetical protein